jgi:hypothetical protein
MTFPFRKALKQERNFELRKEMHDEEERCHKELANAEERYRNSSADLADALGAIADLLDSVQKLKRVSDSHRDIRKRNCMRVGEEWAGPLVVPPVSPPAAVPVAPPVAAPVEVPVSPPVAVPVDVFVAPEPVNKKPHKPAALPKEKLSDIRIMVENGETEKLAALKAAMEAATCILPKRYAEARGHSGRSMPEKSSGICYGCGGGSNELQYMVGTMRRKMHARCKQHWIAISKLQTFFDSIELDEPHSHTSALWYALFPYLKS